VAGVGIGDLAGGARFVGSHRVRALVELGREVTVPDDLNSGCRANLAPFPGNRLIEADIGSLL
jgi:UDP-glucose 4-epimerase